MKQIKIIVDSSANLLALDGVDFAVSPLKVLTDEREFTDDAALDIPEMLTYMAHYKGRSRTSCPNTVDWLSAFGDAEDIICVTITSALSGSYNAALSASQIYCQEKAGRRVFVLDTLSAGPESMLVVEKLREFILSGMDYEDICTEIKAYLQTTGLCFMLKSLRNFANNGRVSPSVAKIAGLLGLCVVGRASDEGTLEPTDKCRGESRSLARLVEHMRESGLVEGRVAITHCQNEAGATALQALLHEHFPHATVTLSECRGLCSYYVEAGGILVGFEKQ